MAIEQRYMMEKPTEVWIFVVFPGGWTLALEKLEGDAESPLLTTQGESQRRDSKYPAES